MSVIQGYSRLQIALHWIVALLIFGAFFTHDGMGRALRQRIEQDVTGLEGATWHTILGGLAFAFILVRIVVRLRRGAPKAHGSDLVVRAANWGHRLLYALIIVAPALGAAAWYGHVSDLGDIHEILGKALVIVAVGHAVVAIAHRLIWKDGTLTRMMKPDAP